MLYDTDPGDLIEFAKAWAELGDAVAEQVADIVDNPATDEVNPAAIELAQRRIRGFNQGLDLAMDEYLARCRREHQ